MIASTCATPTPTPSATSRNSSTTAQRTSTGSSSSEESLCVLRSPATSRLPSLKSSSDYSRSEQLLITNHRDATNFRNKRAICISARVHPGENVSSFVMHGIIDILTGPSLLAKVLRDNFLFFIIPMLNIDGVVVGNYRTNLSAVDLNRT